MRHRYRFTLALAAALAGCTAGEEALGPSSTAPVGDSPAQVAASGSASVAGGTRSSIASLPDRGELLRYASATPGAGSAAPAPVPVSISEDHAFAAIHRKELVLDAPDGVRSRIAYASHQDHGDGNWTWKGRDRNGRSALLTFGQSAVFGSIQRADGSELRIVTQAGRTYAVLVRPDQLRGVETSGGSDALIVPESVAQAAARSAENAQTGQSAAPEGAAAAAAAANEIDVLLGYSTGLAQRIGSASGAQTRMQNLVAIANEGYQNSGVVYRIRLVGTVQVAYGDNTRNDSTLHALTGSTGTGAAPIDPAFNNLRAAREQTGADLVSFVRQFRDPEQDGCGIAWLLGGGQTNLDQSDAPFAYSVVSDGSDVNEGDNKTYFCREETLAHELGHSMGQTHNQEDTNGPGRHSYSYGFREASTSGFFTIMAYRIADSSQFSIRHFANPSVLYDGRATGVANLSDNARSMNETMPVVAQFRNAVISGPPVAAKAKDVNGDSLDDVIWQNAETNEHGYWLMNGPQYVGMRFFNATPDFRIVVTGDFNGDDRADELWANSARALWMLTGNGSTFADNYVATYSPGWVIAGVGDINADGKDDLVWYNGVVNQHGYWLMDGGRYVGMRFFNATPGFRILTVGDFNGDGRADELWTNQSRDLWLLTATASGVFLDEFVANHSPGWTVVGNGDVNGDGRSDLIWHNAVINQHGYWLMDGSRYIGMRFFNATPGYWIESVGDFNGDGRLDELWTSQARDMWMLLGTPTGAFADSYVATHSSGWRIVGAPFYP